jgi:hypothetical protein
MHLATPRRLIWLLAVFAATTSFWFGAEVHPVQADNWTEVYRFNTPRGVVAIAACKQWVPSGYGPMYRVKVLYDRHNTGYSTASLAVYRPGVGPPIHSATSRSWWIGRLTIIETYASAWYNDWVSAHIAGYGPAIRMNQIGFC